MVSASSILIRRQRILTVTLGLPSLPTLLAADFGDEDEPTYPKGYTGRVPAAPCTPTWHHDTLMDPKRREVDMVPDDPWQVGKRVVGRYYRCKRCGRKELLPTRKSGTAGR